MRLQVRLEVCSAARVRSQVCLYQHKANVSQVVHIKLLSEGMLAPIVSSQAPHSSKAIVIGLLTFLAKRWLISRFVSLSKIKSNRLITGVPPC